MVTGASTADLADHPDRRAQGRADADAAAQLPRPPARHPQRRARRQQDGPGRLRSGRLRRNRRGLCAPSRRPQASRASPPSRSPACRATTSPRARPRCTGMTARRCSSILRPSRSRPVSPPTSRSEWRCNGSTVPIRTSAAMPVASPAAAFAWATRLRCSPPARARSSSGSSPSTAISIRPSPDSRSRSPSTDEVDCSRGDLIADAHQASEPVSRIEANLVWMSDEKLVPHRSYWLKIGAQTVSANIDTVEAIIDVNTLEARAGRTARPQRHRPGRDRPRPRDSGRAL